MEAGGAQRRQDAAGVAVARRVEDEGATPLLERRRRRRRGEPAGARLDALGRVGAVQVERGARLAQRLPPARPRRQRQAQRVGRFDGERLTCTQDGLVCSLISYHIVPVFIRLTRPHSHWVESSRVESGYIIHPRTEPKWLM